jgi:hypothetical protein
MSFEAKNRNDKANQRFMAILFNGCLLCFIRLIWQFNQSLGDLILITRIKVFIMNMYDYFIHSLKQYLKFSKLVQVMEMNGNILFFKCEH